MRLKKVPTETTLTGTKQTRSRFVRVRVVNELLAGAAELGRIDFGLALTIVVV